MQMINSQPGGLSGLVQQFHDKGLGGLVTSWVGTGQNLPISADQIQHVLGSEQVKELAAKAGISPDAAGSHLCAVVAHDHRQAHTQRTGSRCVRPLRLRSSMLEAGLDMLKGLGKNRHRRLSQKHRDG